MTKGWKGNSPGHSLAARGIKIKLKGQAKAITVDRSEPMVMVKDAKIWFFDQFNRAQINIAETDSRESEGFVNKIRNEAKSIKKDFEKGKIDFETLTNNVSELRREFAVLHDTNQEEMLKFEERENQFYDDARDFELKLMDDISDAERNQEEEIKDLEADIKQRVDEGKMSIAKASDKRLKKEERAKRDIIRFLERQESEVNKWKKDMRSKYKDILNIAKGK